jgi:glutaminase
VGRGRLAEYIPSLAAVDPHQFGMALAAEGEAIWERVSREPSGNPFNSLLQLDQEAGRPRNPFINAGALVVTDRLHSLTGDACGALGGLMRRESGRADVGSDLAVARSELEAGHRTSALASLFLARDGVLCDGTQLLSARQTKRVNAVMLTCGTYDSAGELAYRVGLPAKSGVGGGILAVIPDRGVACVWSPALGPTGSSAAGLAALDAFTTYSDWTVF